MWNYFQDGDDNLALDRAAGDAYARAYPDIFYLAKQARRFLMRGVRCIAEEGGVRQFLDLGCGLPAPLELRNVHEVAQAIHPDARIVYVDNDPVVISHADALMRSTTPHGQSVAIQADVADIEPILARAADTLDFARPVGLVMTGILGHIAEYQEARQLVETLLAAVPRGSYLLICDGLDSDPDKVEGVARRNASGMAAYYSRTPDEFEGYFAGLDLLPPGCVPTTLWRPEPGEVGRARAVASFSGVGRKWPTGSSLPSNCRQPTRNRPEERPSVTSDWMQRPFQPSTLGPDYFHTPSPARMWNYLQGGDDNLALDRATGDAYASAFPDIFYVARQVRRFLIRAVRYLATEGNLTQYLDLGCGLPAPRDLLNVHEVAQAIHPGARVVYVDNDKVVISHADALLTSTTREGRTSYIEADIRDPAPILAQAAETLDFTQPVGVLLCGVLAHIADYDHALRVAHEYLKPVPPGSYLLVNDGTDEDPVRNEGVRQRNDTGIAPYHSRSIDQFRRYFGDLELVEPGIVPVTLWRPEPSTLGTVRPVPDYGGVARKLAR
jgi:hypothetical protein